MAIRILATLMRDERGIETVEYAVMTALIVTAVVVAFGAFAEAVGGRFLATVGLLD